MDFRAVTEQERIFLYNLLQKYLYEMTNYYGDDLDGEGNYPYPYFEAYFTDPTRQALFILEDGRIVGFILLNRYSVMDRNIDHSVAEFCVLPKERGRNVGLRAARALFERYPGRWEIKYAANNFRAAYLWERAAEVYSPEKYTLPEGEEVLCFRSGQEGG